MIRRMCSSGEKIVSKRGKRGAAVATVRGEMSSRPNGTGRMSHQGHSCCRDPRAIEYRRLQEVRRKGRNRGAPTSARSFRRSDEREDRVGREGRPMGFTPASCQSRKTSTLRLWKAWSESSPLCFFLRLAQELPHYLQLRKADPIYNQYLPPSVVSQWMYAATR